MANCNFLQKINQFDRKIIYLKFQYPNFFYFNQNKNLVLKSKKK